MKDEYATVALRVVVRDESKIRRRSPRHNERQMHTHSLSDRRGGLCACFPFLCYTLTAHLRTLQIQTPADLSGHISLSFFPHLLFSLCLSEIDDSCRICLYPSLCVRPLMHACMYVHAHTNTFSTHNHRVKSHACLTSFCSFETGSSRHHKLCISQVSKPLTAGDSGPASERYPPEACVETPIPASSNKSSSSPIRFCTAMF